MPNVHTAYFQTAFAHVPEAWNEPCDGCLAASRRSHQRNGLALRYVEVDVAYGIAFRRFVSERHIAQTDVEGCCFLGLGTLWKRWRGGEFLQSVYRFVCQKEVLTEVHGFHYVGCNDGCDEHIQHHIGNDDGSLAAVPYQYDARRHKQKGESIDGYGVGRHRRAPQKGVSDDEVAVVDDAVVKAFEREHRLLEDLHDGYSAHVFHSFGTHFLLCVEVHTLEIVVLRVHHVAHDAEGAHYRHHCGNAQLPVYGKQKHYDAYRSHHAACHIGQYVCHESVGLTRILVYYLAHAPRVLRVEKAQRNPHQPFHGSAPHIGFDAESGKMREHEGGEIEQNIRHRHHERRNGIVPYGRIGKVSVGSEQRAHHQPQENKGYERQQSVHCRQHNRAGQQRLAPSHVTS